MNNRKKVLVIDDDPIVEDGYRNRIGVTGEFEVIGISQHSEEAISLVKKLGPDLVIMDLKFGQDKHAGARAIRALRAEFPELKILAATVHDDLIEEAIDAGANTALVRGTELRELLKKMQIAMLGVIYPPSTPSPNKPHLSEREMETLLYLCRGLTNKQIADKLGVKPSTIQTYVKQIFEKLGVQSRAEVVGKALQLRLITTKDLHPDE